jgi:hypothetical protein
MRIPGLRDNKTVFGFMLLVLMGVSCSSGKPKLDLTPVHGKVFYRDQPAAGVLIMFLPANENDTKAARPLATTEPDGSFIVLTDDEEGAPAGDYVVTMQWLQEAPAPAAKKGEAVSMSMGSEPVDKLKGRYVDRKKGFKVKVEKGKAELEPFKLN